MKAYPSRAEAACASRALVHRFPRLSAAVVFACAAFASLMAFYQVHGNFFSGDCIQMGLLCAASSVAPAMWLGFKIGRTAGGGILIAAIRGVAVAGASFLMLTLIQAGCSLVSVHSLDTLSNVSFFDRFVWRLASLFKDSWQFIYFGSLIAGPIIAPFGALGGVILYALRVRALRGPTLLGCGDNHVLTD